MINKSNNSPQNEAKYQQHLKQLSEIKKLKEYKDIKCISKFTERRAYGDLYHKLWVIKGKDKLNQVSSLQSVLPSNVELTFTNYKSGHPSMVTEFHCYLRIK